MLPLWVSGGFMLSLLKYLGWIELLLNCRRAGANQTQRFPAHICTNRPFNPSLHFCPINTSLSMETKATNSNLPSSPTNTHRGEWCLLYLPPHPSLWGKTHFDRPVFMAGWTRVGMNHETDQNHLAGCSFILSAGLLCGSVCGLGRENGACVSV